MQGRGRQLIAVILVEDNCLIRAGFHYILDPEPDIKIIAEAKNGEDALQLVRKKEPDVAIIGNGLSGMGGLETTRRFSTRYPSVRVIGLAPEATGPYPGHLLSAGAAGCLSKRWASGEIVPAIRQVASGKRHISPDIAGNLAAVWAGDAQPSPFSALSLREMEVMQMVLKGNGTKNIASYLHLSPKTVSTYRLRLFEKLDVRNDVELIRLALRFGLLEDQPAF
jgi:two-component system invasion response regulator UvrY